VTLNVAHIRAQIALQHPLAPSGTLLATLITPQGPALRIALMVAPEAAPALVALFILLKMAQDLVARDLALETTVTVAPALLALSLALEGTLGVTVTLAVKQVIVLLAALTVALVRPLALELGAALRVQPTVELMEVPIIERLVTPL
jgi:hypothetical protein